MVKFCINRCLFHNYEISLQCPSFITVKGKAIPLSFQLHQTTRITIIYILHITLLVLFNRCFLKGIEWYSDIQVVY